MNCTTHTDTARHNQGSRACGSTRCAGTDCQSTGRLQRASQVNCTRDANASRDNQGSCRCGLTCSGISDRDSATDGGHATHTNTTGHNHSSRTRGFTRCAGLNCDYAAAANDQIAVSLKRSVNVYSTINLHCAAHVNCTIHTHASAIDKAARGCGCACRGVRHCECTTEASSGRSSNRTSNRDIVTHIELPINVNVAININASRCRNGCCARVENAQKAVHGKIPTEYAPSNSSNATVGGDATINICGCAIIRCCGVVLNDQSTGCVDIITDPESSRDYEGTRRRGSAYGVISHCHGSCQSACA